MLLRKIESRSKLMKLLPTEFIIYKTHLPADKVLRVIAENTEPPKYRFKILPDGSDKIFEGKISGNSFKISRIIFYKNSFLPQISGVINSELDGTAVKVRMNVHPLVLVFIFVFFGICASGWIFGLIASIARGEFSIEMLIGSAVLLFPYALVTGGFKFESVKTKEILRKLLEAKIISD